jgi:hypothetical protein
MEEPAMSEASAYMRALDALDAQLIALTAISEAVAARIAEMNPFGPEQTTAYSLPFDCIVAAGGDHPEQLELPFQRYWRCAHYPSALENFQSTRQTCEWDCHTQKLEWWHGGEHPMPKSWGTPPEDRALP